MNLDGLLQYLKLVVPSVGVLGAAVYWILQKRLEASLARGLEKTKHDLDLEYRKKSVVFEHQKDSFRNVVIAMNTAIERIYGGPSPVWSPISQEAVDDFKRIISPESLYLDSDSDRALGLFVKTMSQAVKDWESEPTDEEIRLASTQTRLIADRLSKYFRFRVGLDDDSNALDDVECLGACRLINTYNFSETGFPTKGELAFREGQGVDELVATARKRIAFLRNELERFRDTIRSNERHAAFFFTAAIEADQYLAKLSEIERRKK